MKNNRKQFILFVATMLMLVCGTDGPGFLPNSGSPTLHAAGVQQPNPPQQADEFVPVKDLGNQEQLPAVPLVIGAYAVAWIAVFLYLWSIWRRLSRVENEIASLSRRVGEGARPGARK